MRYLILGTLVLALLCPMSVLAKDGNEGKTKAEPLAQQTAPVATPTPQSDQKAQEKEMLIANLNNLRNQELRVAVLQQLLNEAFVQLRNLQAVFCDAYKLDVEKFRQGLYRYDDKEGKFFEIKPGELK
jgi:hypothetical protein